MKKKLPVKFQNLELKEFIPLQTLGPKVSSYLSGLEEDPRSLR